MQYLRVKKWKDWQHYKDREPPWVKLHSKLLGDSAFGELSESEQWQLVRVWMVASRSSRFTMDENDRVVPVVPNDEATIRRAIGSLKKVPLAKFVRDGWLLSVTEDDLCEHPNASAVIAPVIAPDKHEPPAPGYRPLEAEGRALELASSNGSGFVRPPRPKKLPVNHEHLMDKLLRLCDSSADDGTKGVLSAYAQRLPESSLAKVVESTAKQPAKVRSRYANGAMQSELAEREEMSA